MFRGNSSDNRWEIIGNNVKLSGNINWLLGNPQIDALGNSAFAYMFERNSSIVDASELVLPATMLSSYCYYEMFNRCMYLTTAPELPATTLAEYCYYSMFQNCSRLTYVKCLAIDISASNCTSYWLRYVSSSGTFVKASSMNGWSTGISGIPSGWAVVNA